MGYRPWGHIELDTTERPTLCHLLAGSPQASVFTFWFSVSSVNGGDINPPRGVVRMPWCPLQVPAARLSTRWVRVLVSVWNSALGLWRRRTEDM